MVHPWIPKKDTEIDTPSKIKHGLAKMTPHLKPEIAFLKTNPSIFGVYTPVNQHSWLEHGPGLKMYFLVKMVIFQPAMLNFTRGYIGFQEGYFF